MADSIGKFTLGELAKRLFQFFGLTANQAIGFDDNGRLKNVTGLGETITEGELALTDVTTANASTDKHGLLKKLSNVATDFMNGAGNWVAVTKSNVGLGDADNTADAAKPVSTATQDALNLKSNILTLETPTGAVNGVNAVFVFSAPPKFVTYQKQIQDLTDDYTLVGSTVTFVVPPVSGTVKGLVSA